MAKAKTAEAESAEGASGGVALKAPAGMETISVGGISFGQSEDGFFVLPAALVAAAKLHLKSFEDAAERVAKAAETEAARLMQEADIPGRVKAVEKRLAAIEEMMGHGVSRG